MVRAVERKSWTFPTALAMAGPKTMALSKRWRVTQLIDSKQVCSELYHEMTFFLLPFPLMSFPLEHCFRYPPALYHAT
jgi:hypothetical protein